MPRRGRGSAGKSAGSNKISGKTQKTQKVTVKPKVIESSKARRTTSRGTSSKGEIDVEEVEKVVSEISEELVVRLGLQGLFTAGDLRDVVENVVQSIIDEGKKINKSSIIKHIELHKGDVYKYLAVKALNSGDLSKELAEFIVYSAPEIAGKAASELYNLLKDDKPTLDTLRDLWDRYGRPTPLKCPDCGFRALTPNLTCMICGSTPSEERVKEVNNFVEELKHAIRGWHRRLIEEVITAGYVYYDYIDMGIKPPSMMKPGRVGALITLSLREKMMLKEHLLKLSGDVTS